MASGVLRHLWRASSLPQPSASLSSIKAIAQGWRYVLFPSTHLVPLSPQNPSWVFRNLSCGRFNFGIHESATLKNLSCLHRNLSYGRVSLVLSEGKPKFETHEVDPPKKDRFLTKKRFRMQKKREKDKRKAANRKDPRRLTVKGDKKKKFANAEERIKCKLERAKIKEALLLEKLKRYQVPKVQGPEVQPHDLTGEEKFFMKKMAQKSSNYVPVGRRGIFGGVILNMHMHWKKHETVKVICKSCKPGQVHQYADDISRLSGGIPIQIIGDDTIIFYRGKNYVQPEVMSPVDTLSKKKALEKSKYQQSLESVRRFIAIAEKELELYYRHIALYGDPNNRNPMSILESPMKDSKVSRKPKRKTDDPAFKDSTVVVSPVGADSHYHESDSEEQIQDDLEGINLSITESDPEDDSMSDLNDEIQDDFEVADPSIVDPHSQDDGICG